MRYIIAFSADGKVVDVDATVSGLEGAEVLLVINRVCALIKANQTPDEIHTHIRTTFKDGLVAIFAAGSPFVLDSTYDRIEKVAHIREQLYQEEIADLKAKLAIRGI